MKIESDGRRKRERGTLMRFVLWVVVCFVMCLYMCCVSVLVSAHVQGFAFVCV